MAKYSLKEKIISKRVDLIDKATSNFKEGDYTFLITDPKWRADHTFKIKYKSASKEKNRMMQILKRTLPQSERKDFKFIAVPEFKRSGNLWHLHWHVITNKKINYSKIDKTNGQLKIEEIRNIEAKGFYLGKDFRISLNINRIGHYLRPFSHSRNVK